MSSRSRAGVTFMQIVGVLAIIVVVAAVLFPLTQHVQEGHGNSRSWCASNSKQLGLAMIQYEQDADGGFPAGTNTAGNGWAGELYPFIKSTGVYHCPNDPQNGAYVSYAENRNLVKQNGANLPAPAATVAFYEFTTVGCDPSTSETNSATGLSAPQNSKRHDSSTFNSTYSLNFAFADGHVKFLTPGQVSGGPGAVRAKALPQGTYVGTFAVK